MRAYIAEHNGRKHSIVALIDSWWRKLPNTACREVGDSWKKADEYLRTN